MSDAVFMLVALRLAARNLGQVWPNPAVGALVVRDGVIVGQGYTARGGRPHAETQALAQAGALAKGATLYVTLEPCSHHGKTPPCVDAVIAAGITRCVIACIDSNPQVSGAGVVRLKEAGVQVEIGVCEPAARALNQGFFSVVAKGLPVVTMKLATSQDGKIATASGQSQWITNERSRAYGHMLRSQYDAILTGSGTWLADKPQLNCRLAGLEDRSPIRVILDRRGRVDAQDERTWVLSEPTLSAALKALVAKGITRVLVEAGAELSTAFLREGLVSQLYWFRAPLVIGGDGLGAIGAGFSTELAKLAQWQRIATRYFENDSLDILVCSQGS
jgi:diaminohydroxyphosphoribosylaminopyrimidine deaminase/5-amino-6-(5-phosphoribosylamino)uracil reductase